jgi:hypothetical protein
MKFDKDIEHIKAHHLILDTIIEIQETQIFILKKLNKLENKLTSLKVQFASKKDV